MFIGQAATARQSERSQSKGIRFVQVQVDQRPRTCGLGRWGERSGSGRGLQQCRAAGRWQTRTEIGLGGRGTQAVTAGGDGRMTRKLLQCGADGESGGGRWWHQQSRGGGGLVVGALENRAGYPDSHGRQGGAGDHWAVRWRFGLYREGQIRRRQRGVKLADVVPSSR
jgi:hypothetical protein